VPTNRGSFPGTQTCSGVSSTKGTEEGFSGPKGPELEIDHFSLSLSLSLYIYIYRVFQKELYNFESL
jgi:hypothetical protein